MQQIYQNFLNDRDGKNKFTNINSKIEIDFNKVKLLCLKTLKISS